MLNFQNYFYVLIFHRYLNGQNVTFVGPGHGSVVQLQTEDWFVYHAWPFKKIGKLLEDENLFKAIKV